MDYQSIGGKTSSIHKARIATLERTVPTEDRSVADAEALLDSSLDAIIRLPNEPAVPSDKSWRPAVPSDESWWPASLGKEWLEEEPQSAATTAAWPLWPRSESDRILVVTFVVAFTVTPLVWILALLLS